MKFWIIAGFLLYYFALPLSAQFRLPHFRFEYQGENTKKIQQAPGLSSYPVYVEGESPVMRTNRKGQTFTAKAPGTHDFLQIIPVSETKAKLVISHEVKSLRKTHPQLGQGGTLAVVPIERIDGKWVNADTARIIDFAPVGWTAVNCGGALTSKGTILTAEEIFDYFDSNEKINTPDIRFDLTNPEAGYQDSFYTIPADYPEFGGQKIPLHKNFGFMVEADVDKAVALHKCYHMGCFSHESAVIMPDNRTVYLTDDYAPACLFKFVADHPNDYRAGNLYAFNHKFLSDTGRWVPVPRHLDTLLYAREYSIYKGASLFLRLEWAVRNPSNNKIYFCETGKDSANFSGPWWTDYMYGHRPAKHWFDDSLIVPIPHNRALMIDHPYGTVLELDDSDPQNPIVRPLLRGGTATDGSFNAANFDGLTYARIGNRDWLIIHEDLIDTTRERMPKGANYEVPDVFLLDLSIENPTVDDLLPFWAGARRSELAGGSFMPDGKTLFINHQHPASDNQAGFNRSATFAVTGWGDYLINIPKTEKNPGKLVVYPNPVLGTLHFNQLSDITVTDSTGKVILSKKKRDCIRLAHLPKGKYKVGANGMRYDVEIY
jgi:secreted PhoX family phosphatase